MRSIRVPIPVVVIGVAYIIIVSALAAYQFAPNLGANIPPIDNPFPAEPDEFPYEQEETGERQKELVGEISNLLQNLADPFDNPELHDAQMEQVGERMEELEELGQP